MDYRSRVLKALHLPEEAVEDLYASVSSIDRKIEELERFMKLIEGEAVREVARQKLQEALNSYEADVSKPKLCREPWRVLECPRRRGVLDYHHGASPRSGRVSELITGVEPGKR